MMRRFILTLEILFVSLFLLGGSFPETETARNTSGGFSWKDYRTIAHALGGMDGKDYLNSREGFLFMYEQGVRLFELDLSRTSDGVWVCRHNWNDSMGQWDGNGKKVLTEKEFRQSRIYGKYTPMTLEDFFLLLKDYPDAYVLIDSKQYSLRNYQRTLEDYSDYVEIARNACSILFLPMYIHCGRSILWKSWSILHPSVKKRKFRQQQYTGSIGQKKRRRSLKKTGSVCMFIRLMTVTRPEDTFRREQKESVPIS